MIRNRLTFERSSLSFWGEGEPPNFAAFEVSQVVDERERGNEFFFASTSDKAAKAQLGSSRICAWICA